MGFSLKRLTLSERVSSPVSSPEDAPLNLSFDVAGLTEVADEETGNLPLALGLCCRMITINKLVSITNPGTGTAQSKRRNEGTRSG